MNINLLILCMLVAALDWFAVARRWKALEYIAKPAVMLLLLAWLWQTTGLLAALPWFAAGLAFSLAGDIFLMLPKERFFPGLVAFLCAHLTYIAGLLQPWPTLNLPGLILGAIILVAARGLFMHISSALRTAQRETYRLPVLVYSAVISLMLFSALLTLTQPDNIWSPGASVLVSAGAILFFLSDTLLAWNRFVTPIPAGRVLVHAAYHLGQIGLIAGAALHNLSL